MKIYSHKKWTICLFVISHFFLSNYTVYGQTQSVLNSSSVTPSQLDSSQLARYNRLTSSQLNDSFQLVEVQNLSVCEVNGMIKLALPTLSCSNLIYTRVKFQYTSENDYYWYGFIDNDSSGACESGIITLMAVNGEKFGSIVFDDYSYEFQELGNGIQLLSRTKLELMDESECGVDSTTPGSRNTILQHKTKQEINRELPCQSDCEVRVLVLWTQAAQNIEGNINNRIALAMAQTNQAYHNSLVSEVNVRLVLAGSQLVNFVESNPGDMFADINSLATNAAIQTLRANQQADIVVLLTGGNYPGIEGIVAGFGPDFNTAYAIVQTNAATTGRFVFAHEVGHLFGARHNNDNIGTIQHGYTFRTGFIFTKKRYTLVTQTPGGKTREHVYSNPDVKIKKKAVGTADHNNNAQVHRNNGCTVANFFPNPLPGASLGIEAYQIDCYTGQAEAIIQCVTAPYTYSWEISIDGNGYQSFGSNTDVVNFSIFCQTNIYLDIRLTVTDGTSTPWIAYYHLEINPNYPLRISPKDAAMSLDNPSSIIQRVYPNPAQSMMKVELLLPDNEKVSVTILDAFGNASKQVFNGVISKGQKILDINTSLMQPGVYKLKVVTSKKVEYRQFIVIK